MCLPNFLIIGTAKAGTTTLFEYCRQHPEIFVPEVKEPRFFEFMHMPLELIPPEDSKAITSQEEYRALFRPGADFKARSEATVYYLFSRSAAQNIRTLIPEVKLFVIVRNPAERAWSHFLYSKQIGRAPESWTFEQAIKQDHTSLDYGYLEMGKYKKYISRYEESFAPSQIHILFFDDLVDRPVFFAQNFFRLLDVDPHFEPDISVHHARSGIPKNRSLHQFLFKKSVIKNLIKWIFPPSLRTHWKTMWIHRNLEKPPIPQSLYLWLIDYYREDIIWLQRRTGRDCSHWIERSKSI